MTEKQELTIKLNLTYDSRTKHIVDLLIRNFKQLAGLLGKVK